MNGADACERVVLGDTLVKQVGHYGRPRLRAITALSPTSSISQSPMYITFWEYYLHLYMFYIFNDDMHINYQLIHHVFVPVITSIQ